MALKLVSTTGLAHTAPYGGAGTVLAPNSADTATDGNRASVG
jgi:hypothetical protein